MIWMCCCMCLSFSILSDASKYNFSKYNFSFSYQVKEYLIVVFITVEYGRQNCGDFSMHHIFVMYDSILYS